MMTWDNILTETSITEAIENFIHCYNRGDIYSACQFYAEKLYFKDGDTVLNSRTAIQTHIEADTPRPIPQIKTCWREIQIATDNKTAVVLENFYVANEGFGACELTVELIDGRPQVTVDVTIFPVP